jgi:diguanylate cyclase (GGDEF)-like protein
MMSRICRWVVAAAVLLVPACGVVRAQRYTFGSYTQDQGLGDLNVHAVFQDREGFLWVGTEGGLFRYDGKRFQTVDLGSKGYTAYIESVTQDAGGRIWVAADTGLYVLENGAARVVLHDGAPMLVSRSVVPGPLDRDGVVVIAKKQMWTVTPEGGDWRVEPLTPGDLMGRKVSALAADRAGHLWLATDAGLMEFDRSAGRVVRTVPDHAQGARSVMLVDRAGNLWLRGRGGVARLRVGADSLDDLTTAAGLDLSQDSETGLAEDGSGRMLTLHAEGIARWEGKAWRFFGKANGLGEIPSTALMADRDGDVWYAQFGHGLKKWQGYGEWEHWTTAEGLGSQVVWGMVRDAAGRMVVADFERLNVSRTGLTGFEGRKGPVPEGGGARAVAKSQDGSLWVGAGRPALMRYGPGSERGEAFPLPARVFNLRAGAEGDVWVATVDGIFRAVLTGGKWTIERVPAGPGAHGMIYEIAQGQHGEMWATGDNDLFHYAGGRWTSVDLKGTELVAGLSNVASAPELADGTVWVSGNFPGVVRLVVREGKVADLTRFSKPKLSSDRVVEIGVDHRGWTWVSTDHGVSVFDGKGWRWMTREDGLIWNDCDSYGFFADDDGSVWIGTSSGLSHLVDPVTAMKGHALPVKITEGWMGIRPIDLSGADSLKWSSGALVLRFASPDLRHEHETTFRYRLTDVDAGWVANDTGEARYAQVTPGNYRFEVMAENRALNARSEVTSIEFEIRPPWWRALWFQAVGVVAIVGMVLLVLLWREGDQRKRQRELEELVAERTARLTQETEELKVAREELTVLATRDHLTKLWNRRAIMDILFQELDRVRRDRQPLVIALIDLDHFKKINDTFGHQAGDEVLREVSARLMRGVRTYDAVGRYGGEELLMVLPGLKLPVEGVRLEAFHDAICTVPVMIGEMPVKVTASFGVLVLDGEVILPEHALQLADEALYRAKAMGRARIEYVRDPNVPIA